MSATNQLLGGRYQFIQVLGTSEAGQTFLVADIHYPGHPKCVIRQLRLPTRNPMTLKFLLSLLKKKIDVLEVIGQHKQIPSTFASFEAENNFYIVQEFIPGRSLADELPIGKPLPEATVLSVLKELLEPIAFAQEHGVIHGSLKPSKVIRHQSDRRLVLLDFGRIQNISYEVGNKESTQGAPQIAAKERIYVAPERFEGQMRFCSDHYSLGMMAIQALTGLPAEELPNAEHAKLNQEIVSLLQGIPKLSPTTASLIARMVHPNPDRRYQKAVDILKDLTDLKEAQPVATAASPERHLLSSEEVSTEPGATRRQHRLPWKIIGIAGGAGLVLLVGVIGLKLPQRFLADQRLRQAQVAAQNDDLEAAIAHYTGAIELRGNHPETLASRSQLYFQTGQMEAALADITAAIEAAPDEPTYVYDRANLRFTIGDVQGAIDDYTTAIQQSPSYIQAYVNRGSARAAWGDDQGAVDDYTEALALSPPTEVQAAAHLNRCLSYSNLGEQVLALEDCSAAINLRPSHGLAYQNRGLVRRRLADFKGSLQDYNIAIQIEPESPDPYYNRGLTRQAMNDLPGAMEDFSKAIAIAPDYVFAFYDRGLLNAHLGNRTAALADLRKASQLCLDLGRTSCYEDAQYQITQLEGSQ